MSETFDVDSSMWTRTYWKPFFVERKLGDLSKADLKSFSLWLAESKNLKPKTINNVLAAGTVALRWAAENELIGSNPAAGLVKFSGTPAKRGVLTEPEVQRLFAQPWADERAWLGNILAMRKVQLAREYWKARGMVFHSWRHYFAARMADQIEARKSCPTESSNPKTSVKSAIASAFLPVTQGNTGSGVSPAIPIGPGLERDQNCR